MADMSDVVAAAVEAAGGAGDGVVAEPASDGVTAADPVVETPVEGAPKPVEEGTKAPDPAEEDDLKAIEAELTTKTPSLKNGRIAVSRHQAVLTRQRRQAEKALEEARTKAVEEAKKQFAQYDTPEFQDDVRALTLARTDADTFFNKVLLATPAYKKLVDAYVAAQAPKPAPAETPDEEPQPDVLNADGTVGYSPNGLRALRAWDQRQIQKALAKSHQEDLEKLRQEVQPILAEHNGVKQFQAATERMRPVLENARARWAGFKDHEKDIAEVFKANPTMTLEQAYDAVVPAKLALRDAQREAEIEARLIKKMNDASAASRQVAPGQLPAAAAGVTTERSIEDIVRESTRSAAA